MNSTQQIKNTDELRRRAFPDMSPDAGRHECRWTPRWPRRVVFRGPALALTGAPMRPLIIPAHAADASDGQFLQLQSRIDRVPIEPATARPIIEMPFRSASGSVGHAPANYHDCMSVLFDGTPFERPVTCEHCGLPRKQCKCPRGADGQVLLPKDQPARVSRERRGGGKVVTIISGLDGKATDLAAMFQQFKAQSGAGGTISDGRIELQGDHRDKLVEILRQMGYPAKPSGG